ncbi:MAG TPA: CHAT domain-containing protein [Thermoanaerobaculia bacterium]
MATLTMSSRPVEGRLSGWPSYHPFGPLQSQDRTALTEWVSSMEPRVDHLPPAEARASLGGIQLLMGNGEDAVARLEEAVRLRPSDARFQSDLAAAYLARAGSGDQREPQYLTYALAAAARAVATDNSLLAGHFNRALALEALGLWPEARRAWQAYQRLDTESGWSDEAAARTADLDRKLGLGPWKEAETRLERAVSQGDQATVRELVTRFPQLCRRYVEEVALTRWAHAQAAARPGEASRELDTAGLVASALMAVHGDRLPQDAVAAIREAAAAGPADRARLEALSRGHLIYHEGLDRYEPIDLTDARPSLIAAREALVRGGSPFVHWAELYLAICDYYDSRYQDSLDRLEPLREETERRGYLALLGRVRWIEGLNHLASSRPLDALEALRSALAAFKRLGEGENVASLHDRISLCLAYLGETAESWRSLGRALQLQGEIQSPRRRYSIFYSAQEMALYQGEPAVALYFLDEAVEAARAWGSMTAIAEALWSRSRVRYIAGREAEALADLREAQAHASGIQCKALKERIQGDILRVTAEARLDTDPSSAIQGLTSALQAYQDTSYPDHLIPVLLARGRAYMSVGEEGRAEEDFRAAIDLYEERRRQVHDPDFRISYFDQAEAAFDSMILFQAERRNQPLRALDYVEQARARVLLELVGESSGSALTHPLTSAAVRERLPEGVALIEYAVLKDRLLVWTVRKGGVGFRSHAISAECLDLLVARLRSEIEHEERDETGTAEELYRLLVQPSLQEAPDASALVFIPDKSLHSLPFGALRQPGPRRFLIEDRLVAVAPSATLYVLASARGRELASRPAASVLAVGNPAFERSEYPALESLPAAEEEAQRVARLYSEPRLLLREDATREAFLRAAPGFEVLHLASHALAREDAPLGAKLVLASEPDKPGSGDLFAADIARLRLPRTQLVVLGACRTAAGRIWKTEGVESMARPFLAAGVPAILASLWNADDRATSTLLQRFHAEVRQGADPVEALRTAQLSLIRNSDEKLREPKMWSGFELIGGAFINLKDGRTTWRR